MTESIVIQDFQKVQNNLIIMKNMSFWISLNDFGTGYSSLSFLHTFSVDSIKLEQSFIRDIAVKDDHAKIAQAMIDQAHRLGLSVEAGGVETKEQLE